MTRRSDLTKSDAYDNGAFVAVDTGFEVQIDELARGNKSKVLPEADGMDKKRTGALYDIPTTAGSFQQQFQRRPALPPGAWNLYEVRVQKSPGGDVYTVLLNGQKRQPTPIPTDIEASRLHWIQLRRFSLGTGAILSSCRHWATKR